MNVLKKGLKLVLVLTLLLSLMACKKQNDNKPKSNAYYYYFDTISYIYSYANDSDEEFAQIASEFENLMQEYHQLYDIYYEYANVINLCSINKLAGQGPVQVDEKIIDLLVYGKEMYTLTNGKFNMMLGSVLSLWHECREVASADKTKASVPSIEQLQEANKHTSIDLLVIDEINKTVEIKDEDASIDVGAIAKGYATEMIARYLESKNITSYVLNVGGNIRIIGTKPDGSGWKTGIKSPKNDGTNALVLSLSDTACVTSGVYERYYEVDGVSYHHIIDPATLYPATYYESLTIVTKDSGLADCLSTALFCMDLETGYKLVNKMTNVEAVWILTDGSIIVSENLKELVID